MNDLQAGTPRARDGHEIYLGLDVHKDSISVAYAEPGQRPPVFFTRIDHTPEAVTRLVRQASKCGAALWCYEAGPCGYTLQRQLRELGQECWLAAPPRQARVKTDRRDAMGLAQLLRGGLLEPLWLPELEHEEMRDLWRGRCDQKEDQQRQRQRLNALALRAGHHWPTGRTRWTQTHYRWLEQLEFAGPVGRRNRDHHLTDLRCTDQRLKEREQELREQISDWSLGPLVLELRALVGIDWLTATGLLAELGDMRRFDNPRQLMAYVGLVPSENSSGARRRQGGIRGGGNPNARHLLIEAAWTYRRSGRLTKHLAAKMEHASRHARDVAIKAQAHLHRKSRRMLRQGKHPNTVNAAIARELVGFVWSIVAHREPATAA